MDSALIIGATLIVFGLFGSIIPALPGPFLSFLGLVIASFSQHVERISGTHLALFGVAVAFLTAADYLGPILGARLAGSTRHGTWGAVIGALLGLVFFPPLGIFIGAFLGAVVGEYSRQPSPERAIRAGLGVVIGSFMTILLQFVFALTVVIYFTLKINL